MQTAEPPAPFTILVVDDNATNVYIIRRILNAHGLTYELQVIDNGACAIQFFDQLAVQEDVRCPDVLLLDLILPAGWHGIEILRHVKAIPRCAGMRVIIISAFIRSTDRTAARVLGADACFERPLGLKAYMQLGDIIKGLVLGSGDTANAVLMSP